MLFLLRSIFWLSIVFASISWPSDPIEHVPKKLLDFFDQDMLQLFDFERVLIDQMIPFDRDAL